MVQERTLHTDTGCKSRTNMGYEESMTGYPPPLPASTGWLTGQLLLAMPSLNDPRFTQSVILICAHNREGAMGLILNRSLYKPTYEELMKQLGVAPSPPQRLVPLGRGGPIEGHRGFVLHSADWSTEGSLKIDETHILSANLNILQAIAEGGGPAQARLLLGYASWGNEQLEDEIRQNVWLIVKPDESLLFDTDDNTKWQRALALLKIDPAMLSGDAGHA